MREEAVLLGPYQSIVGVFTSPASNKDTHADIAVLCITAGLLHHVGPHRLHVLLARSLAEQGISTLRFDLSGIGDSSTRPDDMAAHEIPVQEINEVIAELEKRGFKRFILFGICSGALQAAKAAHGNPKIAGLVLVNTGTDDGNTETKAEINPQAATQFYLKRSLWNPHAWKNLLTGKVKYRELFSALFSVFLDKLKGKGKNTPSVEQSFQQSMQPFIDQGTSILMVLSDRHAQFYELHRKSLDELKNEQFAALVYDDCDHLFTSLAVQQDMIKQVCLWSDDLACNDSSGKADKSLLAATPG